MDAKRVNIVVSNFFGGCVYVHILGHIITCIAHYGLWSEKIQKTLSQTVPKLYLLIMGTDEDRR